MKYLMVLLTCFAIGFLVARLTTRVVVLRNDGTLCAEIL